MCPHKKGTALEEEGCAAQWPNVRGNLTVEAGGVSPDGQDAES